MTGEVRRRSALEVRWRQLRNPPRPILRAVVANLAVAGVAAAALLALDVASGAPPLAFAAYVVLVCAAGSALTWLWVPLPTGARATRRRTPWSAMLGFFAAVPIAYLGLVLAFQVIRPLLR